MRGYADERVQADNISSWKITVFDMNMFLIQFDKLLGESDHLLECFLLVPPGSFILNSDLTVLETFQVF